MTGDGRRLVPPGLLVPRSGRLGAALLVSASLHVLGLACNVRDGVAPMRPALVAIPVALLGRPGGGGGGPAPTPEPAMAEPAPAPELVARRPSASLRPRPAPRALRPSAPRDAGPVAAEAVAAAGGGADGGGEGGSAGGAGRGPAGDGSGGDGSGGARVAYGTNPLPLYPLVARRLGKEGVVLLEVLVAPDGRAAEVRVLRSSGFPPLDESAATTVRERWRFVPARRGGTPVESRVTVPIRFRLEDLRG